MGIIGGVFGIEVFWSFTVFWYIIKYLDLELINYLVYIMGFWGYVLVERRAIFKDFVVIRI